MALEARAFPFLVYDPDAGATMAERLSLEGNPELEETWPTYELTYVGDDGEEAVMTLPVTTADWAATEPRFGRHFRQLARSEWSDEQVPFADFLALAEAERAGKAPFIWTLDGDRRLQRKLASLEMVELAEDRLDLWDELRELAAVKVPKKVRDGIVTPLERRLRQEMETLKEEYEVRIAELEERYPQAIVRRIAEALTSGAVQLGSPRSPEPVEGRGPAPAPAPRAVAEKAPVPAPQPAAAAAPEPEAEEADEAGGLEPYIDSALCTTCNECTNINPKMFAYDANKQAYVKDPRAGTFQELVRAAERCSARIIHPGTPLDPDEPDLDKWLKRAEPFH
jgi:pyruvate-ferredoxin/flavodoxin oxidoreductase